MHDSYNIEKFPYGKRLEKVMQGTNVASRGALRKLRKNLDQQQKDNVVDLEDAREEIKMNLLGW